MGFEGRLEGYIYSRDVFLESSYCREALVLRRQRYCEKPRRWLGEFLELSNTVFVVMLSYAIRRDRKKRSLQFLRRGNYRGELPVDPASMRGELALESSGWWLRPYHVTSLVEVSSALGATCEVSAVQSLCTPQFCYVLRDVHLTSCITVTLADRSVVRSSVPRSLILHSPATCGYLGCLAQTMSPADFFLFEADIRWYRSPSCRHPGAYGTRIWTYSSAVAACGSFHSIAPCKVPEMRLRLL